jgi:hypothetical protein
MNTTTAAAEANVTVATIRTWCRVGAVAAIKRAGRWFINAVSLAHRIAIGAMRARKQTAVTIDLNATYTANLPGEGLATITPVVKRRSTPHAGNIIKVSGLAPIFADRFDAITDEGDRMHALTVFQRATIVISDQHDADWDSDPQAREGGQIRTTYQGGIPGITVDDVLDLAAQLRTQLA